MAERGFTFVNRTGNPALIEQQEDDLPTIRSHASREVHRLKRLAAEVPSSTKVKSRLSSRLIKPHPKGRAPHIVSFQIGSFDKTLLNIPFGTSMKLYNIPTDLRQHLDYFIHGFTPLTFPISLVRHRCDILSLAMTDRDPALIHALCAVAVMYQILVYETEVAEQLSMTHDGMREMSKIFLYHKQCAIMHLQSSIADSHTLQTKSSLGAVALLLLLETLNGDNKAASTHRAGLSALATSNNGVKKPPDSFLLSDILMTDVKSSTSNLSRPSMNLDDEWLIKFDKLKYLPFIAHRSELVSLGSGFLASNFTHILPPDFIQLIHAMRNIINAIETNSDLGIEASNITGIHILVLEHHLSSYQSNQFSTETNLSQTKLQECLKIAFLLYCNLFLWSFPKSTTIIKNLVSFLRTAIIRWKTTDHYDQINEQFSPVLLWLYFIGTFAASNTEDYTWFLEGLECQTEILGIESEDDLQSVLGNFFYVNRLMGVHLKSCYLALETRRS